MDCFFDNTSNHHTSYTIHHTSYIIMFPQVDYASLLGDLEELQEIVENMDMAHIHTKCSLHTILLDYLYLYMPYTANHTHTHTHTPEELRDVVCMCASILATVAQNNILVQDILLTPSPYTHTHAPAPSHTHTQRNVLDHLVYVFVHCEDVVTCSKVGWVWVWVCEYIWVWIWI
ncbi:hypothetical protein EON63_15990 [archaeon]|nr:MAG: hypothetical protein EON63_15990 [archaeon]